MARKRARKALATNQKRSPTDIATQFGERLRRMRLHRGWDQVDLAAHSGLGREFISALENGRREPCLRSLQTLAQSFEVTVSQLLRGL